VISSRRRTSGAGPFARFDSWQSSALVLAGSGSAILVLALVAASSPGAPTVIAAAVGLACAGGIAWELRAGRPLSLSMFVYVSCLSTFCIRPLYLLAHYDQLASYRGPRTAVEFLTEIRTQEIVEFITRRYPGSISGLIGAAGLVGAVFLSAFVLGRLLGGLTQAREPGFRLAASRPSTRAVNLAIALLVSAGLLGQGLVVNGAGGLGAALTNLEDQGTLQQPFTTYVLANFAVIAALLWGAFGELRGASLLGLCALATEIVGFGLVTGSRSIALMPLLALGVVIHYSRRRFRAREIVAGAVGLVLLASLLLGVRQVSAGRPLGESLTAGVANAASLNVAANDLGQFDAVMMMVAVVPERLEHQNGRRLLAGAAATVPRSIYPGKPENGDVWLREQVWGAGRPAGRPYTFAGELWLDFGWPGAAIGGVLLGLVCGRLRGGRSGFLEPDRAVVTAAVVATLVALLDGVYATAVTVILGFGIPLAAASLLFALVQPETRDG
jgi:hypothetical protein